MPLTHSIQLRALLAAGLTLLVFLLLFTLALLESFRAAQEHAILRRLAADANTLITAANEVDGVLTMPDQLANERFNLADSDLIGMIYSKTGELLWQSRSSADRLPAYGPLYRHDTLDFSRIVYRDEEYFVYDRDLQLSDAPAAPGYSFITMDSAEEYHVLVNQFRRQLVLWISAACAALLVFLGLALRWSLGPLRLLRGELREIETGQRETLSEQYPTELVSLTHGLNRLLKTERIQQQRYRALTSDLAHSLKTPLANIHNTLYRLRQQQVVTADLLLPLDEQAHEMNQIISFQLQRAVRNQSILTQERVPVEPLLSRLVDSLLKVYRDKQIRCDAYVDAGLVFRGNRQAFMEVCGNLLDNAFRLCLRQVRVTVHIEREENKRPGLMLCVEDDGAGVQPERREEILQRGVREDSRHPGQGLGLAITHDIVSQYDGWISVDDSPLGGALFTVWLPQ